MPRTILSLALIFALILPLTACDGTGIDHQQPRPSHVISEGEDDDNGSGGGHP